jgi:two-component sensor histidine kinase
VDAAAFLQQLAENLFSFYGIDGERVRMELQVGETLIDIEQALPFGLILNELLCNTFKYAFPENQRGTVTVKIDGSAGLLVVADDGAGLPAQLDPENSPSLGLQLVHMLVEQIGGTIAVESGRGTRITIKFPAKELDPPLLPSHAGSTPIESPRESPPAQTV